LANVKKRVDQRVQLHKLLSERKIKNNEIVQEYLLKMKEIASSAVPVAIHPISAPIETVIESALTVTILDTYRRTAPQAG